MSPFIKSESTFINHTNESYEPNTALVRPDFVLSPGAKANGWGDSDDDSDICDRGTNLEEEEKSPHS